MAGQGDTSLPEVHGRVYRLISTIGRGGFGSVFRGELCGASGFSKAVAIKILSDDAAMIEDFQRRLRDEARLLSLLHHRAIVKVDDLVQLSGRWAVVMEYVEGADLKALIELGPIPPRVVCEIAGEVASALHVAHTAQDVDTGRPYEIIHRDIKPANIRITSSGEVKVLDFGVARASFDDREAQTRSLAFGSLGYMAPERFDSLDKPAGDVYALGKVVLEALLGKTVPQLSVNARRHDRTLSELLQQATSELPTAFATRLTEQISRMLDYDWQDRPSAEAAADGFQELFIEADGPWLKRWVRDAIPQVESTERLISDEKLPGAEGAVPEQGLVASASFIREPSSEDSLRSSLDELEPLDLDGEGDALPQDTEEHGDAVPDDHQMVVGGGRKVGRTLVPSPARAEPVSIPVPAARPTDLAPTPAPPPPAPALSVQLPQTPPDAAEPPSPELEEAPPTGSTRRIIVGTALVAVFLVVGAISLGGVALKAILGAGEDQTPVTFQDVVEAGHDVHAEKDAPSAFPAIPTPSAEAPTPAVVSHQKSTLPQASLASRDVQPSPTHPRAEAPAAAPPAPSPLAASTARPVSEPVAGQTNLPASEAPPPDVTEQARAATAAPSSAATTAAPSSAAAPSPQPAQPAAPPTGTVKVSGDVATTRLRDAERRVWSPGSVPIGVYDLAVQFEDGSKILLEGAVTIAAGQHLAIRCDARAQACRW